MTVYIVLLFVVCAMLYLKSHVKGMDKCFWITLFIIFLISSLRAVKIGEDYSTYGGYFQSIKKHGFQFPVEKGYVLFNLCLSKLTLSFIPFGGIIVNTLFFFSFANYVKKYVDKEWYVLILFIFVTNPYLYIQSSTNILRQTCATSILLFAISYLYRRKYLQYLLIVILAAQFHKVAYVFGLLVLFRMIKWNKKLLFSLACGCFLANLIFSNDAFMYFIAEKFGFKGYIGYGTTMFDFLLFAVFIFTFIAFLLLHYESLYKNQIEKFWIDLYVVSLCALLLLVKNDIAYRIYIALIFFSLPAIPLVWKAFGKKRKEYYRLVRPMYVSYYILLYLMFFITQSNNVSYVPFRFFWQS